MSQDKQKSTQKKNDKVLSVKDELTEFIMYTTPDGNVKVEIFVHRETIWLTQEQIAVLFGVQRPAITKHLKNIFESGELEEKSVSSILDILPLRSFIQRLTGINPLWECWHAKRTVSHRNAEKKAYQEYDEFNKIQKIESDFDREIKKMIEQKKGQNVFCGNDTSKQNVSCGRDVECYVCTQGYHMKSAFQEYRRSGQFEGAKL